MSHMTQLVSCSHDLNPSSLALMATFLITAASHETKMGDQDRIKIKGR